MLAALAVIAVVSPVTLSASRPGDSPPIDVSRFVAEIARLQAEVAEATPASLAELRARLPPRWVVHTTTEDVDVPARWLAALVEQGEREPAHWPSIRARALTRLAAVRAEAASFMGRSEASDPAAAARGRTVLQDVLGRREFAAARTSSWTTALRERIEEWLLDLWRRLGGERLGRRQTAIVLTWMAVVAALGVLVSWIVKGLLRARRPDGLHLTAPASRRKSARAWAREALAAADPAEAARCGYHAALRRLEEEGTWRTDETRTPREYLRLLPPAHGRRPILADITARFEQIRYGARAATAEDARSVLACLEELGCLPAD